MTRLFEVEQVAVHRHLVVAGVLSDGDDILHAMAHFTKLVYEKIDIYHGLKRRWIPGQGCVEVRNLNGFG